MQVDVLKARLKDPRVDERHTKEVLVRLIYVEMLGHDASWGHVTALRACSSKLLITKKAPPFLLPPCEVTPSARQSELHTYQAPVVVSGI